MSVGGNIPAGIGQAGPGIGPPGYYSGGPLIADDAGTVAHVTWNGSALVDSFGNSWTQNGTVPQVAKSGRTPAGAGPFSDANYYSLGTGNDVLDFAGDFTVAVVFAVGSNPAANTVALLNGQAAVAGYAVQFQTGGLARFATYTAGSSIIKDTVNALSTSGLNVICAGRATATQMVKLNLGAIASGAAATITAATALIPKIGRYESAGLSFGGTIYEIWLSTSTPSDAAFIAIQNRVKTRAGVTAW